MGRFEIHNYGKNLHFPYTPDGGIEMEIFLYRNKTERTDDAELAEICEKFPNVGVIDTGFLLTERFPCEAQARAQRSQSTNVDFSQFTKKELVEEAKKVGILNARHKNKDELTKLINSAMVC